MDAAQEADLAWALADTAAPRLRGFERTAIFTALGCGDHLGAIEQVLCLLAAGRQHLPGDLAQRAHKWLDCYQGGPDEPRLRYLIRQCTADQVGSPQAADLPEGM